MNSKVILISGVSGTGKSTLTKNIFTKYQIPYLKTDNLRWFLQHIVDRQDAPELFTFLDNSQENITTKEYIQKSLAIANYIKPGVCALIELYQKKGIIIGGIELVPHLYENLNMDIKQIFIKLSKDEILENISKRGRPDKSSVEKQVEQAFEYQTFLLNMMRGDNIHLISKKDFDKIEGLLN